MVNVYSAEYMKSILLELDSKINILSSSVVFLNKKSQVITGELTATKVYNAVWNDYAEKFEKHPKSYIEAGDIVSLDVESGSEVYRLSKEKDACIAGVCSDEYGHLLGGTGDKEYDEKHFCNVGLAGRVKTKVIGKIKIGDRIVPSSIPGVGRKYISLLDDMFSIVGYATESNDYEGIKKVRVKLASY